MIIIDEKGRLFGKINIIDLLVILFLFLLIPMFYFGYKIFTKNPKLPIALILIEQKVECKFIKLDSKQLNSILVGDKELNEQGEIRAEIVELGKPKPYIYKIDMGSGENLIKDPTLQEIAVTLRLKADVKSNSLYYKDKPLSENSNFDFETDKYKVAMICNQDQIEEHFLGLDVLLRDLKDGILELISIGDAMYDAQGRMIAKILNIGKIEDNELIIDLNSGNYVRAKDESRKQLNVRIQFLCQVGKQGEFYFEGRRIKYNTPFEFKTDKYSVNVMLASTFVEERWLPLQVRFTGVLPEVANAMKNGDIEKDNSGRVIGRVISIMDIRNSVVYGMGSERFIGADNPFQRDVYVKLELLCNKRESSYSYKDTSIKVGNYINFTTDLYSISGNIVAIEKES